MSSVYSCLVLLISYLLKRRLVRWFVGYYFVYDTQGVFYGEGGVTAWSDFFIAILFISAKKRIILTSRSPSQIVFSTSFQKGSDSSISLSLVLEAVEEAVEKQIGAVVVTHGAGEQ